MSCGEDAENTFVTSGSFFELMTAMPSLTQSVFKAVPD